MAGAGGAAATGISVSPNVMARRRRCFSSRSCRSHPYSMADVPWNASRSLSR
jgi:hypothetical protein